VVKPWSHFDILTQKLPFLKQIGCSGVNFFKLPSLQQMPERQQEPFEKFLYSRPAFPGFKIERFAHPQISFG
jgi:hypothetical protein